MFQRKIFERQFPILSLFYILERYSWFAPFHILNVYRPEKKIFLPCPLQTKFLEKEKKYS